MENRRKTCRLCLRACENFQVIEASTTNMLEKLKLEINLPASGESLICTNCAETLINSFDFITMCVDTHQYIVSYLSNKENAKVDLKEVYLSKNENDLNVPKDHIVCGFCIGPVESCSAVSLDYELGKIMLERCLPELDLSIIENPIICVPCHESLDRCFHFVKDCLRIEEKIQEYREAERIDSKDLVELANIQEYQSRMTLKSEEYSNIFEMVKVETLCEDGQYANEEVKHDGRLLGVEEQKLNNAQEFTINNALDCKEEHDKYGEMVDVKGPISVGRDNEIKQEIVDPEELENIKFLIKEDGSLMQVQDQHDIRVQEFPSELEESKFLNAEDIEVKTDQDDFDSFQEPVDPLEISAIISETRPKIYMEPDELIHERVSQETMLKCDLCSYEARHKSHLERHLLIHKNPSEINMFKCTVCSYKTKRKDYLKYHISTHKSLAEVKTFKCEMCPYKTKRKYEMKLHGLIHRSSSEVTTLKCAMCTYETKQERYLKRHLLIHKSDREINMVKCEMCPYETKQKCYLKRHLLIHKSASEVNMFKCTVCSYKTKRKDYLKYHISTHKSPAEVNIFKCETCPYKTKTKFKIKQHSLVHKSSSEVTMFKCETCTYETKHKSNLKRHLLTHKSHA